MLARLGPDQVAAFKLVVETYSKIANIFAIQKKYALALENFQKCLTIQLANVESHHEDVAMTHSNIEKLIGLV